jgi:hypothetical protein
LSGEKPPHSLNFPGDIPALYSPWVEELSDGSYYYRGEWETIDHILLSDALFTGSGWNYAGSRVLNHTPFTASDGVQEEGGPRRLVPAVYQPRNGRGLSDHFPLLLYLRYTASESK